MIIVLADDFSGAAEMGGIGFRYGLTSKIQTEPTIKKEDELLIIDTNTRSVKEDAAIEKIRKLATELKQYDKPFRLFKKVDSVMRGHIATEINVLEQELGFHRVLLLPANPGRERKIIAGHYYINGNTIDKTVFADDPDFPAHSSSIEILLQSPKTHLPHIHIQRNGKLPYKSFITADVETKQDIQNYLKETDDTDLCVGAAECFEAWLENLGYRVKQKTLLKETKATTLPFIIIMNGSTVKDITAQELLERYEVPQLSLPGEWKGDKFVVAGNDESFFHQQALELLNNQHIISVTIDKPIKKLNNQQDVFSGYFVKLMHYISRSIDKNAIHFCLTGGSTSVAVIESPGIKDLYVKEEVAPGIVTLESSDETKGLFTVKPGSYPWPEFFLRNLVNNK